MPNSFFQSLRQAVGRFKRSRFLLSPLKLPNFKLQLLAYAIAISVSPGAAVLASSEAAAEEYELGPLDRIRLKVYEWRPSRDEIFEWTALNDEFVVSPSGTLSLPFVAEIQAQGLSPAALAEHIGQQLQRQMKLARAPNTSVDIVQFRPFYILGDAAQPGEFPYRPGLTVLKALSLAGGLRTDRNDATRFQRDVIVASGDLELTALSKAILSARKARLEAELSDASEVTFPSLSAIVTESVAQTLVQQETLIFEARRQSLDAQAESLRQLRAFLEQEAAALQNQLDFDLRQIEIVNSELEDVSSLVDNGLATAPRRMALEREVTQLQAEHLATHTSLLRAKQEISRTDISIQELSNGRRNDVTLGLRDAQDQLDALEQKAQTSSALLYEAQISAPHHIAQLRAIASAGPKYTIVRLIDGSMSEIDASESDVVRPGDTIKVELPAPPLPEIASTLMPELLDEIGSATTLPIN